MVTNVIIKRSITIGGDRAKTITVGLKDEESDTCVILFKRLVLVDKDDTAYLLNHKVVKKFKDKLLVQNIMTFKDDTLYDIVSEIYDR